MNYKTVLARLYIIFVTGINLENSLALWIFGYFSSFIISWALARSGSRHCSVLFYFLLDLLDFTALHCSVPFSLPFFKPRPLSFAIFLATSVPVNSCSRLFPFTLVLWRNFINSAIDWVEPQKTHENKFSLVLVMAPMLRDSVVVVRTRPRAIPLATITFDFPWCLRGSFPRLFRPRSSAIKFCNTT